VLKEIHREQIEGTKVKSQFTRFQKQTYTYRPTFHSLFKSKGDKRSWQTFPFSYCYSIDGKDNLSDSPRHSSAVILEQIPPNLQQRWRCWSLHAKSRT